MAGPDERAAIAVTQRYTFVDQRGSTIAISTPGGLDFEPSLLAGQLQLKSCASLINYRKTQMFLGPSNPQPMGAYGTVGDVAVFAFQGESGHGTLQVQLPAPTDDVFLSDAETVDTTACAALIAEIQSSCLMPSGEPVGAYLWGFRRKLTERKY